MAVLTLEDFWHGLVHELTSFHSLLVSVSLHLHATFARYNAQTLHSNLESKHLYIDLEEVQKLKFFNC